METTYKVQGKESGLEFIFKYDLNGILTSFEKNAALTEQQRLWLYSDIFPENEEIMSQWIEKMKSKFTIHKVPASVTFEDFWQSYGKIGTKSVAKKRFEKLKPHEVINAFIGIEKERNKKKIDGTAMPYAETYLNQKRWE